MVIAIDTESHGKTPWSIQVSTKPGTGILVRLEDTEAVAELVSIINDLIAKGCTLVFHHSIADLDIVDKVGIRTDRFRDTLQEAYQQCHLPQGLKALAYRLFGITMRSWADTVWPASVAVVTTWMEDALALAVEELTERGVEPLKRARCVMCGHTHAQKFAVDGMACCKQCFTKTGSICSCQETTFDKVTYRPSAVEAILRHVLAHTAKTLDDDEPYDPWKALKKMRTGGLRGRRVEEGQWEWLEGQEQLGDVPILGIGNVELNEAVRYGCEDASVTGMVADALEAGRTNDRWKVDYADYDR